MWQYASLKAYARHGSSSVRGRWTTWVPEGTEGQPTWKLGARVDGMLRWFVGQCGRAGGECGAIGRYDHMSSTMARTRGRTTTCAERPSGHLVERPALDGLLHGPPGGVPRAVAAAGEQELVQRRSVEAQGGARRGDGAQQSPRVGSDGLPHCEDLVLRARVQRRTQAVTCITMTPSM